MPGCLVYFIAAVALWRLWGSGYGYLWWAVLAGAVLVAWTAGTVRTAYRQEKSLLLSDSPDSSPVDEVLADEEARNSSVVNFWVKANMAVAALTAVLAIIGLVLSFL